MGITYVGDDFCRRVFDVFNDIPNTCRVVEDIMIFSSSYEEHMEAVHQVFTRAKEYSISLNHASDLCRVICCVRWIHCRRGRLPTSLNVDASRLNGLGFLLKQQGAKAQRAVVQVE